MTSVNVSLNLGAVNTPSPEVGEVTLTERAKQYMQRVCKDRYMTLSVSGGGCSGYRYVWGQTNEPSEEWLKPIDDILLIDTMTELLVKGSVIDYVEGLAGSFLDIQNPMQKTACGCGLSFGV